MTNYQKGYSFEAEFVKKTRALDNVVLAERFHKSIGPAWKPDFENLNRFGNYKPKYAPVDSWHLTKDGRIHFTQMKKNTQISTSEMLDLVLFAMDMGTSAEVYLVTKKKKVTNVWHFQQLFL